MSTKITAVDADAQVQALAPELSGRGCATSVTGDWLHHHRPCMPGHQHARDAYPRGCARAGTRLRHALCPGSCITISHVTNEGRNDGALAEITVTYNRLNVTIGDGRAGHIPVQEESIK